MKIKCSIVIPCYNVAEFLPKLFDSIQIQKCNDLEYLFVDDGSVDNTGALLDDFCEKKHTAKVLHQKNTGVCGARNAGLKTAQGDYVFFLDGDDYLTDNASEIFAKVAEEGADIVCFKNLVQKGGYDAPQRLSKTTSKIPKGIYDVESFLTFDYIASAGEVFRLYRRQILTENQIAFDENLSMGEVTAFFIHCLVNSQKIQMCDDAVMVYLVRPNSISRTVKFDKDYSIFDTLDQIQDYCDTYSPVLKSTAAIKRIVVTFSLGFTINKYAKSGLPWCIEIARCFDRINKDKYYRKCFSRMVFDSKARRETRAISLMITLFPARIAYNLMKTKKNS